MNAQAHSPIFAMFVMVFVTSPFQDLLHRCQIKFVTVCLVQVTFMFGVTLRPTKSLGLK